MLTEAPFSAGAIEAWMISRLMADFDLAPAVLDPLAPFESFGLSSREVVTLSGDLEEWLGLDLSPVLLYEYPSIRGLSVYLAAAKAPGGPTEMGRANGAPANPEFAGARDAGQAWAPTAAPSPPASREPIAIVGMAARFPGADSLEAFWQALVQGKDCIRKVPDGRWDIDQLAVQLAEKKTLAPWGGFLERVDEFDAAFFGISGREAVHIDPQQRMLLEVTWEALANAGMPVNQLAGQPVGVYVGISGSEYGQAQMSRIDQVNGYFATGSALSVAANRLSYYFDWRGPSMAIDTACSASLVAVHLACRSLRAGESRLAVAAGANLILTPAVTVNFNEAGAMAADGRCKAFDARADGYVRSEGVGVVVLKPLARAQADGDRIYAVILGSAINQDGRTNGLMAPNPRSQEEVLQAAYRDAGVRAGDLSYVEAHGTGTLLGDPIEAKALAAVRRADAGNAAGPHPLRIGSVKTNVGHLEAAAGVAGLVKVALALHHQQLPASLHFETPNPLIPFDDLALRVQAELEPWPQAGERAVAGISSFGFGGANAHVVLASVAEIEARSEATRPAALREADGARPPEAPTQPPAALPRLLLLSARTGAALAETARRWSNWLDEGQDFEAVCCTAARRQTHLDQRLALVAASSAQARDLLNRFLAGEADPRLETGAVAVGHPERVVFVCPGQGSQWLGMGRELFAQQPAFRRSLEQTSAAFRPFVDWDLVEVLFASELPDHIDVIQPVLFALSVALAALWREMGVEPAAVIGHSMGEVAAAHIAGVLSLEDASRVICGRSRLLRQISGNGMMALVELTPEEAEACLAGWSDRVAVAAINGPRSVVLSGEPAAVEAVLADLQARGVFGRRVIVDVASHSPQVDKLRRPLLDLLAPIRPRPARLPVYSTVTGELLAGPEMDAHYWANNLRRPVLFAPVVARLQAESFLTFVELSPHPVLLPALGQMQPADGRAMLLAASMRRAADEWETLLASLGQLHAHGCPVDWSGLYPRPLPVVWLPPYPWQRERFWFEPGATAAGRAPSGSSGSQAHPLLGAHSFLATEDQAHLWQGRLSLQALPYLADHRVRGQVIFPAAGYVEMALAAAARFAGDRSFRLEGVQFEEALTLPAGASVAAQLVLTAEGFGQAAFHVATADRAREWTRHARGFVCLEEGGASPAAGPGTLAGIQERFGQPTTAEAFYGALAACGLQYGPAFRRVVEVWTGEGEALVRLSVPDVGGGYQLHPAVLDAAFQALAAAMPESLRQQTAGRLFLPTSLGSLRQFTRPTAAVPLWCYTRLSGLVDGTGGAPASVQGSAWLLNQDGEIIAAAEDLRLRAVAEVTLPEEDRAISRWFYRLAWEEQPLIAPAGDPRPGTWLLFARSSSWLPGLSRQLSANGRQCLVVFPGEAFDQVDGASYRLSAAEPDHFRALLRAVEARVDAVAGIVYGWGLAADADEAAREATQAAVGVLHLAQALAASGWRQAPRVYALASGLAGASLAGLAATLNHEHPEYRCTVLDLGVNAGSGVAEAIARECLADSAERQVAFKGGQRYAGRLRPHQPSAARGWQRPAEPASGQPRRLQAHQPGLLDSLCLTPMERRAPAAGEVEIAVQAAGLNFLDLLSAMGSRPDQREAAPALGLECAGRVTAVGDGVTDLQAGDDVLALAPGAFASFVTTKAELVARRPAGLGWEPAATLPIAFLTAYHALCAVGRAQPGERVLIHSAASGTGLAAVRVAQWLNADIYATAGSDERRAYLHSLGVRHVFDSRSLAFVEGVRQATGGDGVDVVVNSLSGEAIPASLSLLRPRGRFIELGKRDLYAQRKVGLYALRRNLSVSVVDLAGLAVEDPAYVGRLLRELLPLFERGALEPLPHECFALADASAAFRQMAQARHHGKVVLQVAAGEGLVAGQYRRGSGLAPAIRPDGSYLIVGGLGALGRGVAAYLVARGARNLVLAGRGAPSAAALVEFQALEAAGASVHVVQANAASAADMRALFARFEADGAEPAAANGPAAQRFPPLRGIFHAAGVLDDGVVLRQTAERFEAVMAPKVTGSWLLHRLSLAHPVEVFVLFSSAAALLGSPGQASYAAGNAFMDGLARYRQAQGLPALSIQWGPWADIGLAARPDRAARLSHRGFDTISAVQGLRALDWALAETEPALAVMPFDVRQWRQSFPQAAALPLVSTLAAGDLAEAQPAGGLLRAELQSTASAKERRALLEKYLRREIATVLRVPASRIGPAAALDSLGFDSLLALELRNRLELSLAARLSATLIWSYPTLPALVSYLTSIVEAQPAPDRPDNGSSDPMLVEPVPAVPGEAGQAILAEVEDLSDEAALRELMGD